MRHTIVPDVITYNGVICVCKEGQQHQQALRLLRAMRCHAVAPDVVTYSVAASVCKRASSTTRPYISYERRSAMPWCRM